jgi:hypothetical protein
MDLALVNFDDPTDVRHDSWVVGDEPYVSLHIVGSERYAVTDR